MEAKFIATNPEKIDPETVKDLQKDLMPDMIEGAFYLGYALARKGYLDTHPLHIEYLDKRLSEYIKSVDEMLTII